MSSPTRVAPATAGRAIIVVLSGSIFLEGLDLSMMGVALPSIRTDLGLSTAALQWVVSAFVVGYAGFVLLGGRAADLFGRRRMFLLWTAVFLIFSVLGGIAAEGWLLILARFVTGVAAAFMTPAGLSIITTTFEQGRRRNQALLVYAGMAAAGFSLGMVAGGLLTAVHWRWVFFAPVLMTAVLLAVAIRVIPRDTGTPVTGGLRAVDVPGAITLTGSMITVIFGLVRIHEVDLLTSLLTFALAAAFGVAFVIIERRSPAPLVRFGILRSGSVLRANTAALLMLASFTAFQFVFVLYLQELRGWPPLQTGLALVILGLDALIAPTLTPRLVARFGNPPVIIAGLLLGTLGYVLLLPLNLDRSYPTMVPSLLLLALSFALAYGPLTILATDDVSEREQGLAGGLVNTSFQFGAALGVAAAAVISIAVAGDHPAGPEEQLAGYRAALVVPVVGALLAAAVIVSGMLSRRHVRADTPPFDGLRTGSSGA